MPLLPISPPKSSRSAKRAVLIKGALFSTEGQTQPLMWKANSPCFDSPLSPTTHISPCGDFERAVHVLPKRCNFSERALIRLSDLCVRGFRFRTFFHSSKQRVVGHVKPSHPIFALPTYILARPRDAAQRVWSSIHKSC